MVLDRLGRTDEAEAKCREALTMDPRLGFAYECLGRIYRRRGDEKRAREEFRRGLAVVEQDLARSSDDHRLLAQQRYFCHALGDYGGSDEAAARLRRVEQTERLGGDPEMRIAGPDSGFLPLDLEGDAV